MEGLNALEQLCRLDLSGNQIAEVGVGTVHPNLCVHTCSHNLVCVEVMGSLVCCTN